MTTLIIIGVVVLVGELVFLFFFNPKEKKEEKHTSKDDTTTAATPAATGHGADHGHGSDSKKGVGWFGVIVICLIIFFVIPWVWNYFSEINKGLPYKGGNTPETIYKEVLELKFDGYTPCNPNIDYKFELDTQGDPIYLKFPGVNTLIHYSGKGTIKVPPRNFGPVKITSLNPKKQVRVRIWEVIKVKI